MKQTTQHHPTTLPGPLSASGEFQLSEGWALFFTEIKTWAAESRRRRAERDGHIAETTTEAQPQKQSA